jgi:hypothetical protein
VNNKVLNRNANDNDRSVTVMGRAETIHTDGGRLRQIGRSAVHWVGRFSGLKLSYQGRLALLQGNTPDCWENLNSSAGNRNLMFAYSNTSGAIEIKLQT